jgi:hypothetical protein
MDVFCISEMKLSAHEAGAGSEAQRRNSALPNAVALTGLAERF